MATSVYRDVSAGLNTRNAPLKKKIITTKWCADASCGKVVDFARHLFVASTRSETHLAVLSHDACENKQSQSAHVMVMAQTSSLVTVTAECARAGAGIHRVRTQAQV